MYAQAASIRPLSKADLLRLSSIHKAFSDRLIKQVEVETDQLTTYKRRREEMQFEAAHSIAFKKHAPSHDTHIATTPLPNQIDISVSSVFTQPATQTECVKQESGIFTDPMGADCLIEIFKQISIQERLNLRKLCRYMRDFVGDYCKQTQSYVLSIKKKSNNYNEQRIKCLDFENPLCIFSSLATYKYADITLNLIDLSGYIDLLGNTYQEVNAKCDLSIIFKSLALTYPNISKVIFSNNSTINKLCCESLDVYRTSVNAWIQMKVLEMKNSNTKELNIDVKHSDSDLSATISILRSKSEEVSRKFEILSNNVLLEYMSAWHNLEIEHLKIKNCIKHPFKIKNIYANLKM